MLVVQCPQSRKAVAWTLKLKTSYWADERQQEKVLQRDWGDPEPKALQWLIAGFHYSAFVNPDLRKAQEWHCVAYPPAS